VGIVETNSVDEQNLARALGSVDDAVASIGSPSGQSNPSGFSFEETTPAQDPVVLPGSPVAPSSDSSAQSGGVSTIASNIPVLSTKDSAALEAIKKNALVELRPLVGKLTVSPEEKFDTYLLIIRSTDDTDLIGPAHEAAKAITDETRRAEALLDIIKEIDYLSQHKKD
jgi:hypothetical protein